MASVLRSYQAEELKMKQQEGKEWLRAMRQEEILRRKRREEQQAQEMERLKRSLIETPQADIKEQMRE
jgi:hypothetical protein